MPPVAPTCPGLCGAQYPSVAQAGQSGSCPFPLLLDLALSGSLGSALGEGTLQRVGMATGLGEGAGSCVPTPSQGLTPACLLGGLQRGGGTRETQGGGFNASAALWLSPSPTGRVNGTVCGQRSLFSVCQPPGYQGEGLPMVGTGREMGLGAPPPLPSPWAFHLPGLSLNFPEKYFPFAGGYRGEG